MTDDEVSKIRNAIVDWCRREKLRSLRLLEKRRDQLQAEWAFRSLDIC